MTLKKVLVEYLEGVREHEYIQDKEMELAEALLKYVTLKPSTLGNVVE